MIVVDTSAVLSVFLQEADALRHARRIEEDDDPVMSAANVLETSIVLRTAKRIAPEDAEQWLDRFLRTAGIRVEPVTRDQIDLARLAHARFGKGTGHAAQLNYGDCFAYAPAKRLDAPILSKGNDFTRTDLTPAL